MGPSCLAGVAVIWILRKPPNEWLDLAVGVDDTIVDLIYHVIFDRHHGRDVIIRAHQHHRVGFAANAQPQTIAAGIGAHR